MKKRIISLALVLCMVFTLLPVSAFAAEAVASGTCGDNLTWALDSEGTLTISGTGKMTNYTDSSTVPWYSSKSNIKTAIIENGVTSIGNHAFEWCNSLVSVEIPDSVKSIGNYALSVCRSLTSISIPSSVTSVGHGAFSYCESLTSITIPSSVTSIGSGAFSCCTSLTSVTNLSRVTKINSTTFQLCIKLTSVTIPYSVTNIDYSAFESCKSLASITIPSSVTSIGTCAFSKCESLTSITIPSRVTSIDNCAFELCKSLTSITIPSSVTSIGSYAFRYCSSLSDVYYSGTSQQWSSISIGQDGNDELGNAVIHYKPFFPMSKNERLALAANGINQYGGHYYAVFPANTAASWNDAKKFCEELGGYLAVISSKEENTFLYKMICDAGINTAYFGYSDAGQEGTWVWLPNEKSSYTNWNSGEPNSESSGEDYAEFYWKYKEGTWNDGSFGNGTLSDNNAFICEWTEVDCPIGKYDPEAFNVFIYRANRMANPSSAEAELYTSVIEGLPCEIMAKALENTDFGSSAAAWKALTTAIESIDGPSKLWESGLEEKDMYSAIILDALQCAMEYELSHILTETESDSTEFWDVFAEMAKTDFNISNISEKNIAVGELSSEQLGKLQDRIKSKLKKESPEFLATDKFFDVLDSITDGTELVTDYFDKIATYSNLLELEDSMKEVVRQMYSVACESDADLPLRLALEECVRILDSGDTITYELMRSTALSGALRYVVKELADAMWDSVMTSVKLSNPAIAAAYVGYHSGKLVCNTLFSTDDLVECYFNMFATMECEHLMADTVSSLKYKYLSDKSVSNAKSYLDSVKLTFGLAQKDCDAAYSFCDTSDNAVMNKILQAFGQPDYSEVKTAINSLKEAISDQQKLIDICWVYSLEDDLQESSLFEAYRTITDVTVLELKQKYRIACPVNIYVYDTDDKLVAYVDDGKVFAEGNIVIKLCGDEKTVSIYDDADYRIVCEGYDSGTVDIGLDEYYNGEICHSVNFNAIPVSNGSVLSTETGSSLIAVDGKSVSADYDNTDEELVTVTGEIEGGYFIGADGICCSGSFGSGSVITAAVLAPEGMVFDHWYCSDKNALEDKYSVSTSITVPDRSFKVKAIFRSSNPFTDVSESAAYYDAVLWGNSEGIVSGFTATEFRPNNTCTRAQVVTFLWRAAGSPEPTSTNNPFKDVGAKQANGKANPFYKAILWGVEHGITSGYSDGTFRPNDTVTRAQFVTFLWRYEGKPTSSTALTFNDTSTIAKGYRDAVAWGVEKGVIAGYGDNTFRPNATCTRWQVVLFMYRDMKDKL